MTDLQQLQNRFQDYLIGKSDDIENDIISTDDALAEHRLGTYYNAYRIRLIDSLAVDFSALHKVLGQQPFEYMTLDYLEKYPSNSPSVRWFGKNLSKFLKEDYEAYDSDFLAELAEFEWTQGLVFDAKSESSLFLLDDMATVPPEAWASIALDFKPSIEQCDFHWNVPAVAAAAETGNEDLTRLRDDYPVRWLLWRRQFKTHWRSLDVHEAWAFEQMKQGANFAEICEGLQEWVDAENVALTAAGFLKQWINDELVTSVRY